MKTPTHATRIYPFFLVFFIFAGFHPLFQVSASAQDVFDPPALYATWIDDPTTSMTIIWHSEDPAGDDDQEKYTRFEYKLKNKRGAEWISTTSEVSDFPFSERMMHRVDLSGLEQGEEYAFRIGIDAPDSLIYYFRTMPDKVERAINFAAGGDTNAGNEFRKTNIQAMRHDIDFVMFGGDLEYSDGRPDRVNKVYDWLTIAKETFIAADNRVVPILAAIGDHEFRRTRYNKDWGVNSLEDIEKLEDKRESAPYYYAMFPFPGIPTWGALDFGDYMSVLLLHAGAFPPIKGEQTEWLAETLEKRKDIPHIFPIYHHGLYPGVRSEYKDQQKYWGPLFEKYGVYVAFENHDHVYKRTYPIRAGKKVSKEEGIVYLGDGSWGNLRSRVNPDKWYLEKVLAMRSYIIGTIHPGDKKFEFRMYDNNGNRIDSYFPGTE